jgi:hypothetical protein
VALSSDSLKRGSHRALYAQMHPMSQAMHLAWTGGLLQRNLSARGAPSMSTVGSAAATFSSPSSRGFSSSCCLTACAAARASTIRGKVSFKTNMLESVATAEMRAAPRHGRKNGLHMQRSEHPTCTSALSSLGASLVNLSGSQQMHCHRAILVQSGALDRTSLHSTDGHYTVESCSQNCHRDKRALRQ